MFEEFLHLRLLRNTRAKLPPCLIYLLAMLLLNSVLFKQTIQTVPLFANWLSHIAGGEKKKQQEKKSEAKSGVIISTCGAKSLKESPMFGHLSLARDRVSGQNKKTFSTFVSGMKESHLSLATVENSCDTVDQTRLPESAGGVHMAKYLQFLQQMGHCSTPAPV